MTVSTSASVVANSCRLTIISSTLRVDLAVPAQLSVAELLTIVVGSLGPEAADLGAAEGGWVLQRAGEDPLDPAAGLAASRVVDGDVLHLRTRATALPEVAFDDVFDAVATGVRTRTLRWSPVHTARAATVFGGTLLIFTALTAVLIGPDWLASSVTLGVGALLLGLTAAAVGRISRRRGPALTAAGLAVAYAAGCGATALGRQRELIDFGAPQLLVGACAALLAAVVLLVVLNDGVAGFVTVSTVAVLTAVGTGIATATSLTPAGTGGVVAAVALAASPFLPALSYRLSRLPLPVIPLDATELRQDTSSVNTPEILGRAVRADAYLTGLVAGVAFAIAGAAVFLSGQGVSEEILAVVLGVICLLRARLFTGRGQRIVLFVAGGVALLSEITAATLDAHGTVRLLAFAIPAAVVGLTLLALTATLPGRRYAPPVARAADVLESLLVLSVIPLALGVMGVYGSIRHLG